MSVLMLLEWNDTAFEAYERVNEIMGISGDADAPPGLIEHVACVDGSGMVIADVWESEDALGRFFEERLGPALEEAGLPDTQPRIMETHNRLMGTSDDANVLVLVDIEGFSPAAYDQMTEQMDAHIQDQHPSVAHTAALRDDGGIFVADIWESPEAFQAFAQEQIGLAGEQAGLGEFEPRMVPIKRRIRGAAAAG
jgi:hypothetical protein